MRIALLGSAPSSLPLAPIGDPSWLVWGCSPGVFYQCGSPNGWFELHRWEPPLIGVPNKQKMWFSPEYVLWMAQRDPKRCPVWMYDAVPEIPASRALPVEELVRKYGSFFFTSSLAWMIACAIEDILEQRAKNKAANVKQPEEDEIGLWGVDMAACTSYDTKILTSDLRWVRAEELKVGDTLLAFDEEAQPNGNSVPQRRWRSSEVLEASRLTKPCYRLTLEDGRELICSDDHKWLTHAENECRWKIAKELVTPMHREGRPTKIVKLMDTWAEDRSWEAGYLAAAFDGEGHLSQNLRNGDNGVLRAGFAQRENVMGELVLDAMHKRGFDLTVDSGGKEDGDCRKYTVKGGRVENLRFLGSIRPRRLLEKFKPDDLGMMHKSGTVAVVKAEFIGNHPVIGLRTTTKTFVAEGLASHNTEEYGYQRAGCQHFLLIAADLGIKVTVPPESDLLRPMPLYGINESSHWMIKFTIRRQEHEARIAQANQQFEASKHNMAFMQGALDELNYQMQTWGEDRVGLGVDPAIMAQMPRVRAAALQQHIQDHPPPVPPAPQASTGSTSHNMSPLTFGRARIKAPPKNKTAKIWAEKTITHKKAKRKR